MFLGVNADKIAGGHVFTFALDVEQEAPDMAIQFGSYLAHKYNDEVFKCMESTAAAEAKKAKWDPETHSAKSPEDELMKNLVEIVDGMGWLKKLEQPKLFPTSRDSKKTSSGFQYHKDTSSVKTFASNEKRKRDNDQDNSDDDDKDSDKDSDDEDSDDGDDKDLDKDLDDEDSDNDDNAANDDHSNEAVIPTTNDTDGKTLSSDMDISLDEQVTEDNANNTDGNKNDESTLRINERADRTPLSSAQTPPHAQAAGKT